MGEVGSARTFRREQTVRFVLIAAGTVIALWIGVATCQNAVNAPSSEGLAACSHFRNVAGDQTRGILTDSQLLAKMQEVADDAPPGPIQRAADQAVRGLIDRDDDAAAAGVLALGKACTAAGH